MRASANINTGPGVVPGQEYGMHAVEAARLRSAEARRFYAENISDDAAASLRASPDFAPAFAEPGEMVRRQEDEAETSNPYTVAGLVIALLAAAACLVAILVFAATRGNL